MQLSFFHNWIRNVDFFARSRLSRDCAEAVAALRRTRNPEDLRRYCGKAAFRLIAGRHNSEEVHCLLRKPDGPEFVAVAAERFESIESHAPQDFLHFVSPGVYE